jgi:hypothetical protein
LLKILNLIINKKTPDKVDLIRYNIISMNGSLPEKAPFQKKLDVLGRGQFPLRQAQGLDDL